MFIEKLAEQARNWGGNETVKAVYVGLAYCCAELENGAAGVAYIFRGSPGKGGCTHNLPKRPLAGSKVSELLDFAGKGPLANSVCTAVANAIFSRRATPSATGDILDHLHLEPGIKVGMVGEFKPLVPVIKKRGAQLTVFDMHPDASSGIHPSDSIPDRLPECDVALITATSIINQTFDDLLVHAASCQHVAVLGPSTPLAPECYQGTPVTCASGIIVRENQSLISAIMEGGGTRMFIPYADKVNITI